MQAVEAPSGDPAADRVLGRPEGKQLGGGHHTVLAGRQLGDGSGDRVWAEFFAGCASKPAHAARMARPV
jgi:hypothetical protein